VEDEEKSRMMEMIKNFNFEFDFPEIEFYNTAKSNYDKDATPQTEAIVVNALCARAAGLMKKGAMFSQIAPHVAQYFKLEFIPKERFDQMVEGKKLIDQEEIDIKEEAMNFKHVFSKNPEYKEFKGEDLFKIVGEQLKKNADLAKDGYNFDIQLPEAEFYVKQRSNFDANKSTENKQKAIRALFDRTWAIMQKITSFNQVAPVVGNLLQAKQISQERFDAMMACKKKIDDEVAAVKKEAMDFKEDFGPQFTSGDQVFPMVQQLRMQLAAKSPQNATSSAMPFSGMPFSGSPKAAEARSQAPKKKESEVEAKSEEQKKLEQAASDRALKELVASEENEKRNKPSKQSNEDSKNSSTAASPSAPASKPRRKQVPGSLGAADALD